MLVGGCVWWNCGGLILFLVGLVLRLIVASVTWWFRDRCSGLLIVVCLLLCYVSRFCGLVV